MKPIRNGMRFAPGKVALIHDWLTGMRGGEKCLEVLCGLLPTAHVYTLIHRRGSVSSIIEEMDIRTSSLQKLPAVERYYRYLLPVMPRVVESWDLSGYDLVVSLSHCVAKSVRTDHKATHICYCFSPMRYAWDLREEYFAKRGGLFRGAVSRSRDRLLDRIRTWDRATADRVTRFVAISKTIQQRIRSCYGRESEVVYPPVDVEFYRPGAKPRSDFYLCVSAFAPYKRIDLAIEACNQLNRKLVIVGHGQDEKRLRALAGPTISFLGWRSDEQIRTLYRTCRALIFPGLEDFGIVPVEAQACGTAVIAFGQGGATETVEAFQESTRTGMFFGAQNAESLAATLRRFEACREGFDPSVARNSAKRFSRDRFRDNMARMLGLISDEKELPRRLAA